MKWKLQFGRLLVSDCTITNVVADVLYISQQLAGCAPLYRFNNILSAILEIDKRSSVDLLAAMQ